MVEERRCAAILGEETAPVVINVDFHMEIKRMVLVAVAVAVATLVQKSLVATSREATALVETNADIPTAIRSHLTVILVVMDVQATGIAQIVACWYLLQKANVSSVTQLEMVARALATHPKGVHHQKSILINSGKSRVLRLDYSLLAKWQLEFLGYMHFAMRVEDVIALISRVPLLLTNPGCALRLFAMAQTGSNQKAHKDQFQGRRLGWLQPLAAIALTDTDELKSSLKYTLNG